MTDTQLYLKLSGLPSNLKSEVADFIDFLKYKSKKYKNAALALPFYNGNQKGLAITLNF